MSASVPLIVTEDESDGYTSTQSVPLDSDEPRLSVFNRPTSSKADCERRTMTIETETVANVSTQSLKSKASADTVKAKPKKKRSKVAVHANHIPTKSEIFAATITQAVDENEESDSDETFVYESNPRSPKKLSRSPSLDSIQSRRASGRAICGKRSMKFASNPYEESRQVSIVRRPMMERRITSPGSSGPNSPKSPRVRRKKKELPFRWTIEDEPDERSPFIRRRKESWSGVPFIMTIVCLMLVVLMIGAAALSTSQPLRDVRVVNITNTLVSKQELIFDLTVEAYNPNALAINVNDVDISVFAQSPYVREVLWPWPHDDSTTLLLGRVRQLDSTLTFDSRFFNRSVSQSRAEIRVDKPGNVTDVDGVETWERVIQHSFDLIIRGVMKYQSSGLSHVTRSSELYKSAHINPSNT